ncbi:uncharacterized protein LOC143369643 [Andrena cerasifolii]|uniref:uncharacterized protein LOC143369643 n=1 Tax=Andrena cerasifolii TaxID=2819439 RepID=UPI0040377722
MKKRGAAKKLKGGAFESGKESVKYGEGTFVFPNGDTYNGGYKFHYGEYLLIKQGKGVYTTDNFDTYDGEWVHDTFAENDIHIRYNNDAEFRGRIDSNGTMNGPGTYTFPDGSSVEAEWLDNKPVTNIIYREPLGFSWTVESESENTISFSPGNHFWTDMSDQSAAHSTESLNQNGLKQPRESKEDA